MEHTVPNCLGLAPCAWATLVAAPAGAPCPTLAPCRGDPCTPLPPCGASFAPLVAPCTILAPIEAPCTAFGALLAPCTLLAAWTTDAKPKTGLDLGACGAGAGVGVLSLASEEI